MPIEHYFEEYGIVPEKRHPNDKTTTIGFSESQQKWYGFAHVSITGFCVIQGFAVGDCVSKADTKFFAHAYIPNTPEGLIEWYQHFYRDIDNTPAQKERRRQHCEILPDRSGIRIHPAPVLMEMANSFEELADAVNQPQSLPMGFYSPGSYVLKCGRGEWTAQTLEDARQMACDFAQNVNAGGMCS